jgi:hypothetical protein
MVSFHLQDELKEGEINEALSGSAAQYRVEASENLEQRLEFGD